MKIENDGNKIIISYIGECDRCEGTGIYRGMGERDGLAVQCRTCKGSGKLKIEQEIKEFKERKIVAGVKKVIEYNPGYTLGSKVEGGMPYQDWLEGKFFKRGMELRVFTCPRQWFNVLNREFSPKWMECEMCNCYQECKHYKDKESCWKYYDKGLWINSKRP